MRRRVGTPRAATSRASALPQPFSSVFPSGRETPPESRRSFSKNQHRVYQMVVTGGLWRHAGPPSGMECLLPQLLRTCLEDSLSGHPSSETASAAESCRPRVAQIRMTEGHGDMRHLSSENLWIY